jgi:hypothetical protein
LKKLKPHINRVILQSDNAKCYQGGSLVLGLWNIIKERGITIPRFIHTETQDGKGSIDAQFAIVMRHITASVDSGMDCSTAKELLEVFKSRGGFITQSQSYLKSIIQKLRHLLSNILSIYEF